MWSHGVVIVDVLTEHSAEVLFPERDDVVDAFTSERPDQSLRNRVCLGCVHRRQHGFDPDPVGHEYPTRLDFAEFNGLGNATNMGRIE